MNTGNDTSFRQAIREGKWKAVRYGLNSDIELYNLNLDIGEAEDLANVYPEKIKYFDRLFSASSTPVPHFQYGGHLITK